MRGQLALLGLVLIACTTRPAAASYLYFSPTAGLWHWDDDATPVDLDKTWSFVYGGRLGYAFTQAFSAEVLGLTGTNTTTSTTALDDAETSETLRLTELSLSLLVHFQSLTSARVYPFLDLGAGTSFRSGGGLDDNHTSFHLGGGIMYVLNPRFALRTNVRDAFFTDKRTSGNLTEQFTVDSLEFSLGVEFRVPTRRTSSRPE